MSIDYNQLQTWVDTSTSSSSDDSDRATATTALKNLGPELAAELLRLRDEIEPVRDRWVFLTEKAQGASVHTLTNIAYEMDVSTKALFRALQEDGK